MGRATLEMKHTEERKQSWEETSVTLLVQLETSRARMSTKDILVGVNLKIKKTFQSERKTSVYLRSIRIGIQESFIQAEVQILFD